MESCVCLLNNSILTVGSFMVPIAYVLYVCKTLKCAVCLHDFASPIIGLVTIGIHIMFLTQPCLMHCYIGVLIICVGDRNPAYSWSNGFMRVLS